MGDVVDLCPRVKARREEETHYNSYLSGPAVCLACKHEWFAEKIPVGSDTFDLICPKCDTRRGQFIYPPNIVDGMVTWQHRCGSTVFSASYLKKDGSIVRPEDIALMNTAGRDIADLHMLCHGCGEFISPDDMR